MSTSGLAAVAERLSALDPGALAAIVAVGHGRAIGANGRLPWNEPEDMAHFRAVTTGHALIIGSSTWADIGRPLPKRTLVVVSRRHFDVPDGVVLVGSPDEAIIVARSLDANPMVAGGGQIYRELLPACQRVWLTDIDCPVDGADAWFPELPRDKWAEVATWDGTTGGLRFRVMDRIAASVAGHRNAAVVPPSGMGSIPNLR